MAEVQHLLRRVKPPPRCFEDVETFHQWQDCQRRCYSATAICEDCTPEYERHMQAQARCDRWHWQTVLYAGFSKSSKRIGESNEK